MVLDRLPGLYRLKYDSAIACEPLLYLCSCKLVGSGSKVLPRSEVLPQIAPARAAGCCPATHGNGSRVVHIWGRKTRHPVCHVTCGSWPVVPAPPTPGGSGMELSWKTVLRNTSSVDCGLGLVWIHQNSSFFTLSPSHQFLDTYIEH